jgi:hypothetical protein
MNVQNPDSDLGSTGDDKKIDPSLSEDNIGREKKEFIPPTDGSWVPRERLSDLSRNFNSKIELLEAKINEQEKKQNAVPPVSRAELLAKVDAGEISQVDADEQWEQQIKTGVADELETALSIHSQDQKVQDELSAYETTVPALTDADSDTFKRVAVEYDYMVSSLGQPQKPSTMVAAVRSVVGPLNALKKDVKITKKTESHEESGGSGGSGGNPDTDVKVKMSARQKEYYRKAIDKGIYKDWAAVNDELTPKEA